MPLSKESERRFAGRNLGVRHSITYGVQSGLKTLTVLCAKTVEHYKFYSLSHILAILHGMDTRYSISQKNVSNTVYRLPVYRSLFSVQNGTEMVNGSYRFSVCCFSVYRILPYTEDVMLGM